MDIPEFPGSREITIADKSIFDRIFTENPPEISAYTFTNIFAWRSPYNTRLSRVGDCLILADHADDRTTCLEPLGESDVKHACARQMCIRECTSQADSYPVGCKTPDPT